MLLAEAVSSQFPTPPAMLAVAGTRNQINSSFCVGFGALFFLAVAEEQLIYYVNPQRALEQS